MRTNIGQKLEKVFFEALKYYEEGKPISEILNLFPDYKKELQEVFGVISLINSEKKKITPLQGVLTQIINQAEPLNVTFLKNNRFLYKEAVNKSQAFLNNIFNMKEMIAKQWKIVAPLGLAILLVGFLVFSQGGKKITKETEKEIGTLVTPKTASQPTAPMAAANADEVVDAFLSDFSGEKSQISEETNEDAGLITSDSQAINDFIQVYSENDF